MRPQALDALTRFLYNLTMTEGREPRDVRLDWMIRARRSEFALSASVPLWAYAGPYPVATPLDIDVHPGIEVGITLSGRVERHFADYLLPGAPGDVWLCAMWEPHAWRVIEPGAERVVLIFLPEFLRDEMLGDLPWLSLFTAPPSQRPHVTTPELRRAVLMTGRKLYDDIVAKQPGWQTAVRLGLLRLLFDLSRGWRPPEEARAVPRAGNLNRIMPALTLLHARNAHGLSLVEAAKACNLGQTRFGTLFRETMGLSFGQFRQRARLASAARLLLTTDLTLDDIAAQLEFTDSSHLHRAFVKHYGSTPGQYRERHR